MRGLAKRRGDGNKGRTDCGEHATEARHAVASRKNARTGMKSKMMPVFESWAHGGTEERKLHQFEGAEVMNEVQKCARVQAAHLPTSRPWSTAPPLTSKKSH